MNTLMKIQEDVMQKTILSHYSSYFSDRYIKGTDNWTRVKDKTTLTAALLDKISKLFSSSKQYKVIDIGCGTLWMSHIVAAQFPNIKIHGIDFAYDAILSKYPELREELFKYKLTFENADWMLYKSDDKYDVIFDFGLFHHLIPEDWKIYIKQIDCFLKPGGSLFLRSFHPTDSHWNKPFSGGHVRKGYYCHYHTLVTLQETLKTVCHKSIEIEICRHSEHVEGLYHFKKYDNVNEI